MDFRFAAFAAVAIASAVAGQAFAADQTRPLSVPYLTWEGHYIGVHGGTRSLTDHKLLDGAGYQPPRGHSGFLAGTMIQRGAFVGGIEADIGFGDVFARGLRPCVPPPASVCAVGSQIARNGIDGHLRLLAGWAMSDQLLVFVAGGLAVSRASAGSFGEGSGQGVYAYDEDVTTKMVTGHSVGLGGEWRASPRLRIRGEMLWDSYQAFSTADTMHANLSFPSITVLFTFPGPYTSQQNVSIARIALIYDLP